MTTTTREKPILFSGPMVRAILEGRKTQTRRIVKGAHVITCDDRTGATDTPCPYGTPGDRLWVREKWHLCPKKDKERYCFSADLYEVSGTGCCLDSSPKWKPSIHMPRWASRLTLEVVSVKVERLHEIGRDGRKAEHVKAEGLVPSDWEHLLKFFHPDDCPAIAFGHLWDKINEKRAPWASNPWVWVVEFKRL